jgi:hydrogenase small subunit
VQSSYPNPTGAVGTHEVIPGKTVINVPGCPPNPYNFLSTVLHILTFGEPPALDEHNRPRFAYGRLIHENCERRPHFDAGRFALEFGDAGHRQGFCLYKIGCKGPETHANCPAIGFGDVGEGNWPVGIGAPCFGCTEKGIGFTKPIHALADLASQTPPSVYPAIGGARGQGASPGAAALVGGVVGVALGAGAMFVKNMAEDRDRAAASSQKVPEREA